MTKTIDFAEFSLRLSAMKSVDESVKYGLDVIRDVAGAESGGVMLLVKRHVELATCDDELACQADQLQLSLGTGPCLESIEGNMTFVIDDTESETRWQPWCREVAKLGVRSVLSVRLATLDGALGSVNLYHSKPGAFTPKIADQAVRLAVFASAGLASAKTEEGLREAMRGRHIIGLAQGMLMERFGLDEDAAFAVLRRYSQDLNLKLRAVAQEFVNTRTLPSLETQSRGRRGEGRQGEGRAVGKTDDDASPKE